MFRLSSGTPFSECVSVRERERESFIQEGEKLWCESYDV